MRILRQWTVLCRCDTEPSTLLLLYSYVVLAPAALVIFSSIDCSLYSYAVEFASAYIKNDRSKMSGRKIVAAFQANTSSAICFKMG